MNRAQRIGSVLGIFMLGACGQILGLDATNSPSDGNPTSATFAVDAVYIGANLQTVPLELDASKIKAWVADTAAAGGFRELPVTTAGTIAHCEFPQGAEGLWQLSLPARFGNVARVFPITDSTREWHAVVTTPGNPQVASPPPNAVIDVRTTLTETGNSFDNLYLFVTGAWANYRFTERPEGLIAYDPAAVSYSLATSLAETPLRTITRNDRAYILQYQLPKVTSIAKIDPFDLVAGTKAINTAQVAVVNDQVLDATLGMEDALQRLQAQITAGATLVENYWRLVASPNGAYPFFWGPLLTAGTASSALHVPYGNPFFADGMSPMLFWIVTTGRVERDPDGTVWRHDAGFRIEDSAASGNRSYVPDSGLPLAITVNGTALTSDKISIAVTAGKPFELSFSADRMDGEWRSLDCYRLDVSPARETHVLSLRLVTDRIRIPDSWLPRGARYKCRLHLVRGSPKALQGDDREREAVTRMGYLDSSSFIVP